MQEQNWRVPLGDFEPENDVPSYRKSTIILVTQKEKQYRNRFIKGRIHLSFEEFHLFVVFSLF